jgi:hypothetical protein
VILRDRGYGTVGSGPWGVATLADLILLGGGLVSYRGILFAVVALAMLLTSGPALRAEPAAAQPGPSAIGDCPVLPENVAGGVEVCIDRGDGSVYTEGQPITVCVTANVPQILIFPPPPPPAIRVTNSTNGGPERVLIEVSFASGQRCMNGIINAPTGAETVRAQAIGQDGRVIAEDVLTFTTTPRPQ